MRELTKVLLISGAVVCGLAGLVLWDGRHPKAVAAPFDTQAALEAFAGAVKRSGGWNGNITRMTVSPLDFDTLIVTMTPAFELQPKRLRLVFTKALASGWEQLDRHADARPSIRLEDSRGQKIGGSDWLGAIEVDD